MKRRHMPGCYCCSPCNVIEESELPFIKIAGYKSEFGWQNMDSQGCCWCIDFTPEESGNWTIQCSGIIGTQKYSKTIAGSFYYYEYSVPGFAGVGAGPVSCGFPDCPDDACPSLHETQTSSVDLAMEIDWSFVFSYVVRKISVCLSKKTVTCEGHDDAEKWILQSSKHYTWQTHASGKRTLSFSNSASSASPCYDLLDEPWVNNSCNVSEEFCCGLPFECNQPNVLLEAGNIAFKRVKFFDELPTGTVQFCDADTPETCDWGNPESWQTSCNAPEEYETELCVSVSGWPDEIYNCMCELTYHGGLDEVSLRPQLRWQTCKPNGTFQVSGHICTYIGPGAEEGECGAFATVSPSCFINLDDPDCDAITTNWPKLNIPPWEEGCDPMSCDYCWWYKDPQEGDCQGCEPGLQSFYDIFLDDIGWIDDCGGLTGMQLFQLFPQFFPGGSFPPNVVTGNFDCTPEANCDSDCCISLVCEYENSTCEFCFQKFFGGFWDLSELTESFECDWVANANYCLTPGCWSIQIADRIQPSSVTLGAPIIGEPEVT